MYFKKDVSDWVRLSWLSKCVDLRKNWKGFVKYAFDLLTDRTPMHLAAERGHTAVVEFLADKFKASVFDRTKDGSTLMHIAALNGHPDTAMVLFKKGVPLLMPNKVRGGFNCCKIQRKNTPCFQKKIPYISNKYNLYFLHLFYGGMIIIHLRFRTVPEEYTRRQWRAMSLSSILC